jgi:nicotinamidase-related amidase
MNDWNIIGKPALLIMHMQQDMIPEGTDRHKHVHESGMIRNQQALLKAFRAKKLPVIFVNVWRVPPTTQNLPQHGRIWEEAHSLKMDGAKVKVIPELEPLPGEPVLTSWPVTAWSNSGLEPLLRLYRAETLVLAGFSTNGVVCGTLYGAADRLFNVVLPGDASSSPSAEAHKAVLEYLAVNLTMVTTTEEVIKRL